MDADIAALMKAIERRHRGLPSDRWHRGGKDHSAALAGAEKVLQALADAVEENTALKAEKAWLTKESISLGPVPEKYRQ